MQNTSLLGLPLIASGQAQKHVTHNEALVALDALTLLAVKDRHRTAPPGTPAEGDRHIVAAGASGAWSGKADQLAAFQNGGWVFYAPRAGWSAFVESEQLVRRWTGTIWSQSLAQLSVNGAAPDAVNRMAVASEAVLYTHAGAGVQVKVNKAAAGDTAAHLFQTGFSGRAEFGLLGNDDFGVKVSPDGSAWTTALNVDRTSGAVSFPQGASGPGGAFVTAGHSHAAAAISDSTATGRSLITAADAAAARTTLVLGNVDNTSDNAKPLSAAAITALAGKENAGAAAAAATASIAAHEAAADPHPQYLTAAEGNAAYQPLDSELTALAALVSAADRMPYFTGAGSAALAALTGFGRSLIDDADAAAARATLGLGTAATETIGASGATVPRCDSAVTWGARQTIAQGTLTASAPFTVSQTLNNAGVAFEFLRLEATVTAAASGSLFANFLQNTVSVFSVTRSGLMTAAGGCSIGGALAVRSSTGEVVTWNGGGLCWTNTSGAGPSDTIDLRLVRDGANILAQRNGANAQRKNIYETYTSASINAGVQITATAGGAAVIGTFANGGAARRNIQLDGANRAASVADATDLPSALTLVNALKAALVSHGIMA